MSKIAILVGTNRPGSNTAKVAAHVDAMYRAIGQPTVLVDLAALPPEIFSPASYASKPESFTPFSDAILQSAGLHVITPEYNGSMPGVLKYFIDMLPFPESFERRPVAFTGLAAGMWGALRPIEQLQAIFAYRNAHVFPEKVFMPLISGEITAEGRLGNEDFLKRLRSQVEGFAKFAATFSAAK